MTECTATASGAGIERPDLGDGRERVPHGVRAGVGLRCHARPRWGDGRRLRRGTAFANVIVCLVARRRDLDWLGLDVDALHLPSHLFDDLDDHGGAKVCTLEMIRKHPVGLPKNPGPRDLTICDHGAEEARQGIGGDERCGHEGALGQPLHQTEPMQRTQMSVAGGPGSFLQSV